MIRRIELKEMLYSPAALLGAPVLVDGKPGLLVGLEGNTVSVDVRDTWFVISDTPDGASLTEQKTPEAPADPEPAPSRSKR